MPKYVTKPTIKEAFQWKPSMGVGNGVEYDHQHGCYYVITIHEQQTPIVDGDYIVTEPGRQNRHYPVKPDIFERGHDKISEKVSIDKLKSSMDARINAEFLDDMKKNGQRIPVHVDKDFNILNGHQQYHTAKFLNWKEIEVKYHD